MQSPSRRFTLTLVAQIALSASLLGAQSSPFNVRAYGAAGNGRLLEFAKVKPSNKRRHAGVRTESVV